MKKEILVIEYNTAWRIEENFSCQVIMIKHREDISGRNLVVCIEGKLCPETECDWCDALRDRCRSRRVC